MGSGRTGNGHSHCASAANLPLRDAAMAGRSAVRSVPFEPVAGTSLPVCCRCGACRRSQGGDARHRRYRVPSGLRATSSASLLIHWGKGETSWCCSARSRSSSAALPTVACTCAAVPTKSAVCWLKLSSSTDASSSATCAAATRPSQGRRILPAGGRPGRGVHRPRSPRSRKRKVAGPSSAENRPSGRVVRWTTTPIARHGSLVPR